MFKAINHQNATNNDIIYRGAAAERGLADPLNRTGSVGMCSSKICLVKKINGLVKVSASDLIETIFRYGCN